MKKGIQKYTPKPAEILADETGLGASESGRFPDRLQRYARAKAKALSISEYIRENCHHSKSVASQVANCGNYLVFRDYYTVDQIKLVQACFCKKHLLCPLCAIRRGAQLLGRYIARFDEIKAANGQLQPYLVTFTVKDGTDLKERYNHLKKSLQYLHRKRHLLDRDSTARSAAGAVWSYEFKRGSGSGLWHPHVHAVWLCETPPTQSALQAEWFAITGDSFMVDIRPIDPVDPVTGFIEVFKYAVKFSDQDDADTWHCFQTLSKKRLVGSFGLFHGIPEPDNLLDDPLEGLPYYDLLYNYRSGEYKQSFSAPTKRDIVKPFLNEVS